MKDKNILEFGRYVFDFFKKVSKDKTMKILNGKNLSDDEKELLAETFSILNINYFSGVSTDLDSIAHGVALWRKRSESFHTIC